MAGRRCVCLPLPAGAVPLAASQSLRESGPVGGGNRALARSRLGRRRLRACCRCDSSAARLPHRGHGYGYGYGYGYSGMAIRRTPTGIPRTAMPIAELSLRVCAGFCLRSALLPRLSTRTVSVGVLRLAPLVMRGFSCGVSPGGPRLLVRALMVGSPLAGSDQAPAMHVGIGGASCGAATINTMSGSSFWRRRLAGRSLLPLSHPRRRWWTPSCLCRPVS